jgi:hypothetical protein
MLCRLIQKDILGFTHTRIGTSTCTHKQKHTRSVPLRNINVVPKFMASHSFQVKNIRALFHPFSVFKKLRTFESIDLNKRKMQVYTFPNILQWVHYTNYLKRPTHQSLVSYTGRFLINACLPLRMGHAVAQLEGRGFDSRSCHWNFSLT